MPGLAAKVEDGGYGFDYRMAMNIPDYWIKTIKEKIDEDWKPSSMFWEVTNRRQDEKTISYAESHDQALVGDKTIIFRLIDGQWLHYHCTFAPPPGEGGRVLLHFGAVDDACAVQVNGHLVGGHRGGYWPFTLDVTAQLNDTGRNSLWVAVQDSTDSGTQARRCWPI